MVIIIILIIILRIINKNNNTTNYNNNNNNSNNNNKSNNNNNNYNDDDDGLINHLQVDGEQYKMQLVVNPNYRVMSATSRPQSMKLNELPTQLDTNAGDIPLENDLPAGLDRGYSKVSFVGEND